MRKLALLVLALPLFSGCAALGTVATAVTPVASAVLTTAVDIAVTFELTRDPVLTGIKAKAFKAVAEQVLADTTAASTVTTVAQLDPVLNAKLASLAPDPVIAASIQNLVGGIKGALLNVIGTQAGGPVVETTKVAIAGVAREVIRVTQFYGA